MDTKTQGMIAFLAVIFVISGLSKASGNPKGLSGTRDVNVPDGFARFTGLLETLGALGLIIGLKWNWILYFPLIGLWFIMAGAIGAHFRAAKMKTAFPAFFLLTLISLALVFI